MADRLISTKDLGFTALEIVMCDGDYKKALKMLLDKINNAPTIEAEPTKRRRWIMKQHLLFHQQLPYCSECGKTGIFAYDYCPHCGAKMDESTMGQVKRQNAVNETDEEDNQ